MTPPLSGLSVLVLDDEAMLRRGIVAQLERFGADAQAAGTLKAARQLITEQSFDFALLDVHLPDGLGTDLLKDGSFSKSTGIIVMTAEGGVAGAVDAMKAGAMDYLSKPVEPASLALVISRARQSRQNAHVDEHRRRSSTEQELFFGQALAGIEKALAKILTADVRLQDAGTPPPPVLIEGETGTGKTVLARWIHQKGPRFSQPLIEANCAAIPEALAESEFFGHEKGAFTDARSTRLGFFEAAHGGTLFLDELASLNLSLQAKLLTVLESHQIRRVGGSRQIPINVRVIGAANTDLRQAVAAGRFREDLFHRLHLFQIQLPPLRERRSDLETLTQKMVERLTCRHRIPQKRLSESGRRRLLNYAWPGNLRELSHEIERALVFEDSPEIEFEQLLGVGAVTPNTGDNPEQAPDGASGDWFNDSYKFPETGFQLEGAIQRLVHHALGQSQGNVSAAARKLGVSRDYVRYRLESTKRPPNPNS